MPTCKLSVHSAKKISTRRSAGSARHNSHCPQGSSRLAPIHVAERSARSVLEPAVHHLEPVECVH
jgi:hypothetical protein